MGRECATPGASHVWPNLCFAPAPRYLKIQGKQSPLVIHNQSWVRTRAQALSFNQDAYTFFMNSAVHKLGKVMCLARSKA